jgi:hypothetical protein
MTTMAVEGPPPTERVLEFLRESNAIEGIHKIDYTRDANRAPGTGHWGAFCDMVIRAGAGAPLQGVTLALWQGLVCVEQVGAGHSLDRRFIGRIRGPQNAVDVRVGDYRPPGHAEVPVLMAQWLDTTNRRASASTEDDSQLVEVIADTLQTFEAIHPFADGNGRVGRLVANWMALRHQAALIIFRASERAAYYSAHRSKRAMRLFVAEKIREATLWNGVELGRVAQLINSDLYTIPSGDPLIIQRHELFDAMERWTTEERERGR